MELILLRHACVPGNLERRFIGSTDQPLAPEGEATARRLAERLPPVELVYRSPMLRCAQTAAILWPHVPQQVIAQLRETDFGPFEGKNHRELEQDPLYQRWLAGEYAPGESAEEAALRARRGLDLLLEDARVRGLERAAAVTHGGTIMALLAAYGRPRRDYYDWNCPNCCGYLLRTEPGPQLLVTERIGEEWT